MADQSNGKKPNWDDLEPERFFVLKLPTLTEQQSLVGVKRISILVRGSDDARSVKATYHELEHHRSIPSSRQGSQWKVRPAVYRAKIWSDEQKALQATSRSCWSERTC
jgi:hypothetical protein